MEDFNNNNTSPTPESELPQNVSENAANEPITNQYPNFNNQPDASQQYSQQPSPINQDGGVFAEKSFAQNPQNYPNQAYYQQVGYQQASQQSSYSNLYSQNQQPQGGYDANPYQNAQPYQQYQQPYQPQQMNYSQPSYVPPVSDIPQKEMKNSSKLWLIILIIAVILLFSAVMIILALTHDNSQPITTNTAQISSQSESNVTVNINVEPRPAGDDSYYQNKETGLLTPTGAAQQVLPSIVNLYGYTTTAIVPYNQASGIIISEDGYILTNAHAVEEITRFKATLNDDREFEATLVGVDSRSDLAVLKIDADDLTPAVLGSSDDMLQGDQVIAIGNAGGYNNTVTVGYVSYVNREIASFTGYPINCIQTDTVLNFGNSGGALVNLYGQVVGIVVSKYTQTGTENIGFAIASDFAVPIVEDLIENGYVTNQGRMGIIYRFIDANNAATLEVRPGLLIAEIDSECDISNTDLQVDDIITEINGIQLLTATDIKKLQTDFKAGDTVTAKVYRKTLTGEESEFEITFKLAENKGEID